MSEQCEQCAYLRMRVERLEEMRSGVIGVVAVIKREYQRQGMPRTRLVQLVDGRLREAVQLPPRRQR